MTEITGRVVTFDADELVWFATEYGTTEWIVYVHGMDEIFTYDKQAPGDFEPVGEPFTQATARERVAWVRQHFGPGVRPDLGNPLYAVALHRGRPVYETAGS